LTQLNTTVHGFTYDTTNKAFVNVIAFEHLSNEIQVWNISCYDHIVISGTEKLLKVESYKAVLKSGNLKMGTALYTKAIQINSSPPWFDIFIAGTLESDNGKTMLILIIRS